MTRIRVFLVDDHAILRAGLRLLINRQHDMEVVGEAGTLEESLRLLAQSRPEVVTLDLSLPGVTGLSGVHRIREAFPQVRILVLTMHDDPAYLQAALAAGVQGYLVKKVADTELIGAIRAVYEGRLVVDVESRPSTPPPTADSAGPKLSARERLVLQRVAEGMTNQQIADQLDLSVKSIESYRSRLMKKLGLTSRAEIYNFALLAGLLEQRPAREG